MSIVVPAQDGMLPSTTGYPLPPNALSSIDQIFGAASGLRPIVFLDYDGTLSPIVSRPELAFMSDDMRSAVQAVARKFVTSIVTGRSTQKIIDFVKLDDIFYAGSHGLDICGPNMESARGKIMSQETSGGKTNAEVKSPTVSRGESLSCIKSDDGGSGTKNALDAEGDPKGTNSTTMPITNPPLKHCVADTFVPTLQACRDQMLLAIKEVLGAKSAVEVEDNTLTFSVHYRNAKGHTAEEVHSVVASVLKRDEFKDQLVCTAGKMVFEIRPKVAWNKGTAVVWLLDRLCFGNTKDLFIIYLGDDVTDEDAFRALSKKEKADDPCKIASIVIEGTKGRGTGKMTRPTHARWSLRDTHEVQAFLEALSHLDARFEATHH